MYFARPADNSSARADKAVLLLPDIYGLAIPYALRYVKDNGSAEAVT